MTPLQFIEVGVAPDESDDEDVLAFAASDDYEDDACASDNASERDCHAQVVECYGWETYHPDTSEFDADHTSDNDQSPAIRRTGHQTFISCLADDGDWTDETEAESEASAEKTIAPRSIYTVTATEPADFFKEHWQTQECAGERQFEDYDDWFCEDYDAYDADRDDGENDDEDSIDNTVGGDNEDRIEVADEDDDEQVFRLGD